MAEGSSTPEEAIPVENKSRVKFDQFGEIAGLSPKGGKPENTESSLWVDPDDLPENEGMQPGINLARLKRSLDNANPVEVTLTGELKELPVTPPPQTK